MKKAKSKKDSLIRVSIGFPAGLYRALETMAVNKKVSLAWIVRDAAEKYVQKSEQHANGRGEP